MNLKRLCEEWEWKKKGISSLELSKKTGISVSHIYKIKNYKKYNFTIGLKMAKKLAKFFGVTLQEFLDYE